MILTDTMIRNVNSRCLQNRGPMARCRTLRIDHSGAVVLIVTALIGLGQPCAHAGVVRLRGTITHPGFNHVVLANEYLRLDSANGFSMLFYIDSAGYTLLRHGDSATVFLTPQDSMVFTADGHSFLETLQFAGRGAELNNFLVRLAILERQVDQYCEAPATETAADLFSWNWSVFAERTDSLRHVCDMALSDYLESHRDTDRKIAKCERARIQFRWARWQQEYPTRYREETGAAPSIPGPASSSYLHDLNIDDPEFMAMGEYRSFVEGFIVDRARGDLARDTAHRVPDNRLTEACYQVALEAFAVYAVQDVWLTWILERHITNFGTKGIDSLYHDFIVRCGDNELIMRPVRELYETDPLRGTDFTTAIYKLFDGFTLDAYIFKPPRWHATDHRPAIVLFHGGDWNVGTPGSCFEQCRYWASRGMVAVAVQYRLHDRQGTTPLESIADAKSAIRWLRTHRSAYGIDGARIVGCGESAGAHLAACTALLKDADNAGDKRLVSDVPNALLLVSPILDPGLDFGFRQLLPDSSKINQCSPLRHVQGGLPPTSIIQGMTDEIALNSGTRLFTERMTKVGNMCELHTSMARVHLSTRDPSALREILSLSDKFLVSLGFLEPK